MTRKQQGKELYTSAEDYILEAFTEDYAGLAVVPVPMAALAARISRSGIEAAIKNGKLDSVVIEGAKYVYVRSLRPRVAHYRSLNDGIWQLLVRQAKKGAPTTYGPIAEPYGLDLGASAARTLIGKILEGVSLRSYEETKHLAGGGLLISALVQQKGRGVPSGGFFSLAKSLGLRVGDPAVFLEAQLKGIYRHYGRPGAR